MAESRKKVLLNFELKCNDQGQKRMIKAMADFNPVIPNSLITNYSTEFDESESVNIIQQLSDGGIQVAKTGKAFELRLEADNFEFTLNIKPKYQRRWGQNIYLQLFMNAPRIRGRERTEITKTGIIDQQVNMAGRKRGAELHGLFEAGKIGWAELDLEGWIISGQFIAQLFQALSPPRHQG